MANLRPTRSVTANFARIMPRLVRRYFRRGRRLAKSQPSNVELHQFRIRTKHIRYIAELYAGLFPHVLKRPIKEFQEIQQILGFLQDQCMIVAYFEKRLMHVRTPARQVEYLRVLHRARMRQISLRNAFFRRWASLERSGLERKLLARIGKIR